MKTQAERAKRQFKQLFIQKHLTIADVATKLKISEQQVRKIKRELGIL